MIELARLHFIANALAAFERVRAHAWLVLASVLLDVGFFFSLGFFTTPIKDKLLEQVIVIGSLLSQQAKETGRALGNSGLLQQLFQPEIKPYTINVLLLFLSMVVVTYVVYVIFQGSAWAAARNIASKKTVLRTYLLGFARVNLLWGILYLVYLVLDLIASLRHRIIELVVKTTVPDLLGTGLFIAAVIVGLIALLSYPQLSIRNAFRSVLDVKRIIPMYALLAVIYLVLDFLLTQLLQWSFEFTILIGAIIVLPVMAWARVYIIEHTSG